MRFPSLLFALALAAGFALGCAAASPLPLASPLPVVPPEPALTIVRVSPRMQLGWRGPLHVIVRVPQNDDNRYLTVEVPDVTSSEFELNELSGQVFEIAWDDIPAAGELEVVATLVRRYPLATITRTQGFSILPPE